MSQWAADDYRLAKVFYDEGNLVAACRDAHNAADGWAKVVAAMQANPELESAFRNPAQVYQNAKNAAADRDTIYCRG